MYVLKHFIFYCKIVHFLLKILNKSEKHYLKI